MFPKEDIITVKSWMDVGDCNYEHDHKKQGTIPDSGVVYCNIEHISEFFDRCKDTDNKYVVVSGFSDYGVAIQSEYPVCLDMFKFWPLLQNTVASLGYEDLKISARCDKNLCNINHKYSVRCNSFTHSTFDEIPDNVVKWFCCNACAKDEKIIPIPFGVNHSEETIEELSKINQTPIDEKENWLYVNFQNYTHERTILNEYFASNNFPWVTQNLKAKPHTEYLSDISRHAFVLSPEGNGVDCYRTLESLYCGSFPVVMDSLVTSSLEGLPVVRITSFSALNLKTLRDVMDRIRDEKFNYDRIRLSYWKKEIEESRSLL